MNGKGRRSGYGSTGDGSTEMVQIPMGEYQALRSKVDSASATALRAEAAALRERPLSASAKCGRILGALGFLGLVSAVVYLAIRTQEAGSDETPDPCEGREEGLYAVGFKMLNLIVGQVVEVASDATVLVCNAAHKEFSEISQVYFRAMNSGPLSLSSDFIHGSTLETFLERLREIQGTPIRTGSGGIGWTIAVEDIAGGIPFTANGTIHYVITAERQLRAMIGEAVDRSLLFDGISAVSSGLYNAASVIGDALQGAANSAWEWGAWAMGY